PVAPPLAELPPVPVVALVLPQPAVAIEASIIAFTSPISPFLIRPPAHIVGRRSFLSGNVPQTLQRLWQDDRHSKKETGAVSRRLRKGHSEGPFDPPRASAIGRSPTALTRPRTWTTSACL